MANCVFTALVAIVLASIPADARKLQDLLPEHSLTMELLAKDCIEVHRTGHVATNFDIGAAICLRDDALVLIQEEYSRMLEPGVKPEFVVHRSRDHGYAYTNKHGQKSHMAELHKALADKDTFHAVIFVEGERFFGSFRALIHLKAIRTRTQEIDYRLHVYAYPENALVRLVARLAPVRRYFNHKTDEISALAERITENLCRNRAAQHKLAPHPQ